MVELVELALEDVVGQLGADGLDAVFGEVSALGVSRPDHHVNVGVVAFVMEGGVPAQVRGWYLHGRGDLSAVAHEELPPCGRGVIAQPGGVLSPQGEDECPLVSGMCLFLRHRTIQ